MSRGQTGSTGSTFVANTTLGSPPKGNRGVEEYHAKAALWAIQAAQLEALRADRETAVGAESWWGPLVKKNRVALRTTDVSMCTCTVEKSSGGPTSLVFSGDPKAVFARVSFAVATGSAPVPPERARGVFDEANNEYADFAAPTELGYTEEEIEFMTETVLPFVRIVSRAVEDDKLVAHRLSDHGLELREIEEGRSELTGMDDLSKRLMFRALHILVPEPYVEYVEPVAQDEDEGPQVARECEAVLSRLKEQSFCLLEGKVRLEQGEYGASRTLAERFTDGPTDDRFTEAIAFAEAGCFLAAKKALEKAAGVGAGGGDITIIEP